MPRKHKQPTNAQRAAFYAMPRNVRHPDYDNFTPMRLRRALRQQREAQRDSTGEAYDPLAPLRTDRYSVDPATGVLTRA